MIKLEPKNSEWYHSLYNLLRWKRREIQIHSTPTREEREAILEAMKRAPENPIYIVSMLLCIVEEFRYRDPSLKHLSIQFGDQLLNSAQEIATYVKRNAR